MGLATPGDALAHSVSTWISSLLLVPMLVACTGESAQEASREAFGESQRFRQATHDVLVADQGNIRAELGPQGLLARRGVDELSLRFSGWGREGFEVPVTAVAPVLQDTDQAAREAPPGVPGSFAEIPHVGIAEYWQVVPRGLAQSWVIHERPLGAGPLSLHVSLEGALDWEVEPGATGARLIGSAGRHWRYSGLAAWDARGESLVAWMDESASGLRIQVIDAGAAYPLVVDPELSEDVKLLASTGGDKDNYGYTVSGAGDIDADGYDDIIIGAPEGNSSLFGSAYVYFGSSLGIDVASEHQIQASDGIGEGDFGVSVSDAGDVNGDGYGDVAVSESRARDSVYVYQGSASGIDNADETIISAPEGSSAVYFGRAVSGGGDVDGDGYDDLVVASPDQNEWAIGSAYVYYGSVSGLGTSTDSKVDSPVWAERNEFATMVSLVGDVNGDGYDDVLVGARYDEFNGYKSGSAYLYLGAGAGLDTGSGVRVDASDGDEHHNFASSVSSAGDVDGDGRGDVIIGASGHDENGGSSGAAYVYFGNSAGIDSSSEVKLTAADGSSNDDFGEAVYGAGDVDNDGFDDVVIGAPGFGDDAGASYVFFGGSRSISAETGVRLTASDGEAEDRFGGSVSVAGDVNGDGYGGVLIGARGDNDNGQGSGSAYLFVGVCSEVTWYADDDGDGYGDLTSTESACEAPSGHVDNSQDCNDSEPLAWTGAVETCDDVDNDCDGTIDNDDAIDAVTWYGDADGDGYGATTFVEVACDPPSLYVDNAEDCDDLDPSSYPGATELCDDADNDCDGTVDNTDAADTPVWYADRDDDGFTDDADSVAVCDPPSGYAAASGEPDCDDGDGSVFPGADEVDGDGVDQDCDGEDPPSDSSRGCEGCVNGGRSEGDGWLGVLGLVFFTARRRRNGEQ